MVDGRVEDTEKAVHKMIVSSGSDWCSSMLMEDPVGLSCSSFKTPQRQHIAVSLDGFVSNISR